MLIEQIKKLIEATNEARAMVEAEDAALKAKMNQALARNDNMAVANLQIPFLAHAKKAGLVEGSENILEAISQVIMTWQKK